MPIQCVVFDFDGTLTDVEAEGHAFIQKYQQSLAHILNIPLLQLEYEWQQALNVIMQQPSAYGWMQHDKIVAPGHTDPYITPGCIANILFDQHHLLSDPKERHAVLYELFQSNYTQIPVLFRPNAAAVIDTLIESNMPVFIVSNSRTDAVIQKLEKLTLKHRDKLGVIGNAQKFVLAELTHTNDDFESLPESMMIPNLERPVYLRRGHYFEALCQVFEQSGATSATTLVCGDHVELDLAMHKVLGGYTYLVGRNQTPDYEKDFIRSSAKGCVGHGLNDLLAFVQKKRQ